MVPFTTDLHISWFVQVENRTWLSSDPTKRTISWFVYEVNWYIDTQITYNNHNHAQLQP